MTHTPSACSVLPCCCPCQSDPPAMPDQLLEPRGVLLLCTTPKTGKTGKAGSPPVSIRPNCENLKEPSPGARTGVSSWLPRSHVWSVGVGSTQRAEVNMATMVAIVLEIVVAAVGAVVAAAVVVCNEPTCSTWPHTIPFSANPTHGTYQDLCSSCWQSGHPLSLLLAALP